MNIFDAIDRLEEKEQSIYDQTFVAPILNENQIVLVKFEGFVYRFQFEGKIETPNFYKIRPISKIEVETLKLLTRREISSYLNSFPFQRATITGKSKDGKIIALTQNWPPVIVALPPNNISTFDSVWIVTDGVNHFFKDFIRSEYRIKTHLQEQLSKETPPNKLKKAKGQTPVHTLAYRTVYDKVVKNKVVDKQTMIKELIRRMGANFRGVEGRGEEFIVKFEVDGETFRPHVDKNLRLVSAGICLNSTDRIHDLTSFVSVAREGLRRDLIHRTD